MNAPAPLLTHAVAVHIERLRDIAASGAAGCRIARRELVWARAEQLALDVKPGWRRP